MAALLFTGCGGSRQASSTEPQPATSIRLVVAIEHLYGIEDGGYRLYAVDDDRARLLSSHAPATGVSLAPDGQHVAYIAGEAPPRTLFVEDLDGGSRQTIAICREAACETRFLSYAWSPSGDRLLYTTVEKGHPHIRIASLTGEVLAELAPDRPKPKQHAEPIYFADAKWSPHGRWITVVEAGWDKWGGYEYPLAVDISPADSSDWRRVLPTMYGRTGWNWPAVSWAPDERFAIAGATDEPGRPVPLYAVFAPNGRQLSAPDCGRSEPFCPTQLAWSPDGRWIAWVRLSDLVIATPDLKRTRHIKLGSWNVGVSRPAWSQDGHQIAVVMEVNGLDSDVVVVPAAGGKPRLVFSSPRGEADWQVVSHAWQAVTG